MRHLVYDGRTLIWDADFLFPQRSLLKFLVSERGVCRCPYGCWETPRADQDCGCTACQDLT